MKIRKLIIIVLGAAAICIPAYFILIFWGISQAKFTTENLTVDTATSMVDTIVTPDWHFYNFSDSLPHYQYIKLEDSVNQVYQRRQSKDRFFPMSVQWGTDKTGLAYEKKYPLSYYADSVMPFSDYRSTDTAYYLRLGYYSINWEYKLFREKGKTYMKYPVWDTSSEKTSHKKGHYEKKEIYIAIQEQYPNEHFSEGKNLLYVPISKKTFGSLKILMAISGVFLIAISTLIIFVFPILILQQIAKGKAFTRKTLRLLYIVSWGLLSFYLYGIIIFYTTRLLLSNRIPTEFTYNTYEVFSSDINYAFAAIFSFAFAIAFKKGHKLQQEQDLTV